MFKFLTKTLFALTFWRQYKRAIISTLALFVAYAVATAVHGDYVSYAVTAQDTSNLFASYIVKWSVLVVVTLVYYYFNKRSVEASCALKKADIDGEYLESVKDAHKDDPFSTIRKKRVLESRANK